MLAATDLVPTVRNPDTGNLRLQLAGFRDCLRLLHPPDDDAELVAADTADDVGRPHVADQLARDRLEQRIAGAMAVAVVDALEAVEIDEHQRGLGPVTLHMRERPLELALEAAAVEDVEQRIDVGAGLKLSDRARATASSRFRRSFSASTAVIDGNSSSRRGCGSPMCRFSCQFSRKLSRILTLRRRIPLSPCL